MSNFTPGPDHAKALPGDTTTPAGVAKAITYIVLAVVAVLIPALSDDKLSEVEIVNAGIAFLGAIPVYYASASSFVKAMVAFALAAAQALVLILATGANIGDVSIANWLGVLVAALAGIGVAIVPNKPAPVALEAVLEGRVSYTEPSPDEEFGSR